MHLVGTAADVHVVKELNDPLEDEKLQQQLDMVDSTIGWLHNFSLIVRSSGVRDPLSRAARFKASEEDSKAIDSVESAVRDILDRFAIGNSLADRIANAVILRRKYFLHCRAHQERLSRRVEEVQHREELEAAEIPEESDREPQSRAEPQSDTAELETFDRPKAPRDSSVTNTESETIVTEVVEGDAYVDDATPRPPASDASSWLGYTGTVEIPRAPEIEDEREHRCPYCCLTLQAETFTNDESWRRHVVKDLRPYVCIHEDCPFPEELFSSSRQWREHLRKPHKSEWVCPLHHKAKAIGKGFDEGDSFQVFRSKEEFETHLEAHHHGAFSEKQINTLKRRSHRTVRAVVSCPFCDLEEPQKSGERTNLTEGVRLYQHIGQHLLALALLSLPPRDDIAEDENAEIDLEGASDFKKALAQLPSYNPLDQLALQSSVAQIPGQSIDDLASDAPLQVPSATAVPSSIDWQDEPLPEAPALVADRTLASDTISTTSAGMGHGPPHHRVQDDESDDETGHDLRDEIYNRLVRSTFDNQDFLPEGHIDLLITREVLVREFGTDLPGNMSDQQFLSDFVMLGAKKVFATCLLAGLEDKRLQSALYQFIELGFDDNSLPVTDEIMSKIPFFGSRSSPPREPWTHFRVSNFCRYQWLFLAPIFSPLSYNLDLQPGHILPLTSASLGEREGWFASLHRFIVHPSHFQYTISEVRHRFNLTFFYAYLSQTDWTKKTAGKNIEVALKEMKYSPGEDVVSARSLERDWQQGIAAHRDIGKLNHPHIIRSIAAITRGDKRYLMYEWADGGNLWDYWRSHKRPELSSRFIKEIVEQFRGLADALESLHNYRAGSYRHGDLSPENILRLAGQGSDQSQTDFGVLKLSGFGLAKRHTIVTALRAATTTRDGTRRYEAPETVTQFNQGRSRRYDIWSIGCIMLELLIWILYGYEGLHSFYSKVVGEFGERNPYYAMDKTAPLARAQVHPAVEAIMTSISRDRECRGRTALGDLLHLIKDRLLVVNLNQKQSNYPASVSWQQPSTIIDEETSYSEPEVPSIIITEPASSSRQQIPSDLDSHGRERRSARADARELRDGLDDIMNRGEADELYWFTGMNRAEARSISKEESPLTPMLEPLTLPLNKSVRRTIPSAEEQIQAYQDEDELSKPVSTYNSPHAHPQHENLRDQLFSALVRTSQGKEEFLPLSLFEAVLTEECVKQELSASIGHLYSETSITQTAKKICGSVIRPDSFEDGDMQRRTVRSFRKVFATLVIIEKTRDIIEFIDEDVADSDLPLIRVPQSHGGTTGLALRRRRNPEMPLQCCRQWNQLAIRNFEQWQWTTLSPFFSKSEGRREITHYILEDQAILPFVEEHDSGRPAASEVSGGFSSVFKVNIHPDHHNFSSDSKVLSPILRPMPRHE